MKEDSAQRDWDLYQHDGFWYVNAVPGRRRDQGGHDINLAQLGSGHSPTEAMEAAIVEDARRRDKKGELDAERSEADRHRTEFRSKLTPEQYEVVFEWLTLLSDKELQGISVAGADQYGYAAQGDPEKVRQAALDILGFRDEQRRSVKTPTRGRKRT